MKQSDIIDFINQFNSADIFVNGMCYYFALILKERFNGDICYIPSINHFISYIDGKYYDVNGVVITEACIYQWDTYKIIEPLESKRIIRDCILKIS